MRIAASFAPAALFVLVAATARAECLTAEDCPDLDGQACTVAVCSEAGECAIEDRCTEICRDAGFWGTHSGSENGGENLGQNIIDQAGPLILCRRAVATTEEVGTLRSALEGLCVREEGVELRDLARQLTAASLNCAISEGGSCDRITRRFVDVGFDACNSLCAGDAADDAPTVAECIRQMECFNTGGRMTGGVCTLGRCANGSSCGAEAGHCSTGSCEPFEDACSRRDLCNVELAAPALLCPAGDQRASSASLCKVARANACTVDSCDSAFDLLSLIAVAQGSSGN
jgi:hypothetical protein